MFQKELSSTKSPVTGENSPKLPKFGFSVGSRGQIVGANIYKVFDWIPTYQSTYPALLAESQFILQAFNIDSTEIFPVIPRVP